MVRDIEAPPLWRRFHWWQGQCGLALVEHPLQRQHRLHPGGAARLQADLGIFEHQAVGRVGAEQLGHFQEGVGVGLVVVDVIGTDQHGDIGIQTGVFQDVQGVLAR